MSNEIDRVATWLRQYAIRMPNGELFGIKPQPAPVEDFSVPSWMRDMEAAAYSMLGISNGTNQTPRQLPVGPIIFTDYQTAKQKLDEIRAAAHAVGVNVYGGEIVERLCTPFSTGDLIAQFGADLQAWMETNGGVA